MLESFIRSYGYLAVFIGTFLEGETILVLGGFAAHRGMLNLSGVVLAAFAGCLASDQLMFFIGRRRGSAMLARRPRWKQPVERFQLLLERYHTIVILGFRFLYGMRNVAPFALGMSRVSTARFLVLNVLGAAIWAITVAAFGYFLGNAARALLGSLAHYELRLMGLIALVGAVLWLLRLAWRGYKRYRQRILR